jgi:hypothetical protein
VTTDDPICLRWADGLAHGGLSPGFDVEGTEVIFPLSTTLALRGNRVDRPHTGFPQEPACGHRGGKRARKMPFHRDALSLASYLKFLRNDDGDCHLMSFLTAASNCFGVRNIELL